MENTVVKLPKLVTFPELKERYGVPFTRRHLWNLEQERKFPARVPIGDHKVGWVESEVIEWVQKRIDARNEAG